MLANSGGTFLGQVTFQEVIGDQKLSMAQKRYQWWTVEIKTNRPKAKDSVDLEAIVRKGVRFEITLTNPLDESVTFDVHYEGEGLSGARFIELQAKQTLTYFLTFTPLRQFRSSGQIQFHNDQLGEIWYVLNLKSKNAESLRLPILVAELGKTCTHKIKL